MEMSFREISKHLQIATSTAYRIYKKFELTGDVKQPSRQHCRKLDANHELLLIAMIIENPCLYLREMCE